jgi:hypothetical protein
MTTTHPWTEQELERLIKLLKDGWSTEMIARALSRTTEEVRKKLVQFQMKPPVC